MKYFKFAEFTPEDEKLFGAGGAVAGAAMWRSESGNAARKVEDLNKKKKGIEKKIKRKEYTSLDAKHVRRSMVKGVKDSIQKQRIKNTPEYQVLRKIERKALRGVEKNKGALQALEANLHGANRATLVPKLLTAGGILLAAKGAMD